MARKMGLPIDVLIIGSNQNDILPRTLETGVYEMREVQASTSPSMDIQISSNFERYLFEAADRNAQIVSDQMQMLNKSRRFELTHQQLNSFRKDFYAAAISEEGVSETIKSTLAESNYLLDPHTACGLAAAKKIMSSDAYRNVPVVILSTAHPAKFPDTIELITGHRPALPLGLESLLVDQEQFSILPNNLKDVIEFVKSVS
ncbi:MAG: hypothetical protein ACKOW3_04750 [Hyphomicrobium sp.]